MRVSILQDQLAKGLGIVSRVVDPRNPLPVLGNVLLQTEDSRLKITATNLELSIVTYIGARVDRPGSITLPAKTFQELVNNLSPEKVDIVVDDATHSADVRCGMTKAIIKGIAGSEFPPVPESGDPDVVMQGRTLKEMIAQTVFASAKEESRPILTGILTRLEDDVITMAAADGYRLAVRTARLHERFDKMRDLVIPARALSEVARIIVDEEKEVGISLPGQREQVLFFIDNTVVSSSLLQGKFPDFSAIIPKAYSTAMTVYTSDLLRACKRAEIFARDNAYSARIMVKPPRSQGEPGEVMIIGKSAERGENEGFVDATVEGNELEVAFNIRYLIDVLNVVGEERVIIESNGPAHPGVIRPENRQDFISVIMPMSVQR
ncbi:MAG: DNA polymerase III subunit beta [bacterium]|nr:DNA polymerase III subunit beta [bacterium]